MGTEESKGGESGGKKKKGRDVERVLEREDRK